MTSEDEINWSQELYGFLREREVTMEKICKQEKADVERAFVSLVINGLEFRVPFNTLGSIASVIDRQIDGLIKQNAAQRRIVSELI